MPSLINKSALRSALVSFDMVRLARCLLCVQDYSPCMIYSPEDIPTFPDPTFESMIFRFSPFGGSYVANLTPRAPGCGIVPNRGLFQDSCIKNVGILVVPGWGVDSRYIDSFRKRVCIRHSCS